jgi:hypothetical protein
MRAFRRSPAPLLALAAIMTAARAIAVQHADGTAAGRALRASAHGLPAAVLHSGK